MPWYATFFPLALVLTMNAIKEAFDDYFRHKSDEEVNHRWVCNDGGLWMYVPCFGLYECLSGEGVNTGGCAVS